MTARIALALLVIVPAVMAYPWHSTTDRWTLGVAVAVVSIVFAWWRGLFVTTMLWRRLVIWRRNRGKSKVRLSNHVTVVLRVDAADGTPLPMSTIAGYVDRFGVRCDKVRIISLDDGGVRSTWVAMTIGAIDNLAALRARSSALPLYDTAEIVGRRLADRLREAGFDATIVDAVAVPLAAGCTERWRGCEDGAGFLSAYTIGVDARLADRLAAVWSHPARQTWTAIEFGGTAAHPTVAALAAFRGATASTGDGLEGLAPIRGRQRPVLTALDPRSVERLGIERTPLTDGLLDLVAWPASSSLPVMAEQTRL